MLDEMCRYDGIEKCIVEKSCDDELKKRVSHLVVSYFLKAILHLTYVMPVVLALDTSLSMQRHIPGRSDENALTYHQLALKGIAQLLDYFAISKLEYIAFITYSAKPELIIDFTRDYDQIRQASKKVEFGSKLCLMSMLNCVAGLFSTNWGTQSGQLVVFTDCGLGVGNTSLISFIEDYVGKEGEQKYEWINVLKPIKLNFVGMGVQSDLNFIRAVPIYQQFLDFTRLGGELFLPKSHKDFAENADGSDKPKHPFGMAHSINVQPSHKSELGRTAMLDMVDRVCEANFKPFECILKCGGYFRLECPIYIWPPPQSYECSDSAKSIKCIAPKLEICGYLSLSDIGSPASISRHLIVGKLGREKSNRRLSEKLSFGAKINSNNKLNSDAGQVNHEFEKLEQDIRDFYSKDVKDNDDSGDDADAPNKINTSSGITEIHKESMCVLLHGALKVENLAALVQLNVNWYGFIYAFADSKKKSNLMMSILPPGNNVIPWLGDLHMFGLPEDLAPGETSTFPVKAEKRSYSQNCVIWIKHVSLQSDIQKVLRHAKKIPEKTQNFYKELNRIRRAALSLGFTELLEALATLFEKESTQSSFNAHSEYSVQLKHAALELRKPSNRDFKTSIMPLQKFNSGTNGDNSASTSGFVY